MKSIKGDITDITTGFIFQCVNCQNAMGSGVARAIYEKWPIVKSEYHAFCSGKSPLELLGELNVVETNSIPGSPVVFNCFGQLTCGNAEKTKERYADYGAIKMSFEKAASYLYTYDAPIYFPDRFGSGLAGGCRETIHALIGTYFPKAILVEY